MSKERQRFQVIFGKALKNILIGIIESSKTEKDTSENFHNEKKYPCKYEKGLSALDIKISFR